MQTIHLARKKVKRFILDGKELTLSIDVTSINHFQKANKKGFLKLLEELQNAQADGDMPFYQMLQLLGSCTHYMGQPVGVEFFKEYDELEIISQLLPMLFELYGDNLPEAKDNSEKK